VGIVVAAFDIHRAQISFDAPDTDTSEVTTGRIVANPGAVVGGVGCLAGHEGPACHPAVFRLGLLPSQPSPRVGNTPAERLGAGGCIGGSTPGNVDPP
jgi:hypothetical protein